MQPTGATRMALLTKRNQLKLANQGAGLLRNKRDALLKELLAILTPLVKAHCHLYRVLRHARRSLLMAKAFDGSEGLASLALAFSRQLDLDLEERKFWGARIPVFKVGQVSRGIAELHARAPALTTNATEAATDFDQVLEALLRLLPMEVKLTRLGEEIRKTSRRVNALDQVLIPRLQDDVKHIAQALEEIEREDTFRLRRIKNRSSQNAGNRISE